VRPLFRLDRCARGVAGEAAAEAGADIAAGWSISSCILRSDDRALGERLPRRC